MLQQLDAAIGQNGNRFQNLAQVAGLGRVKINACTDGAPGDLFKYVLGFLFACRGIVKKDGPDTAQTQRVRLFKGYGLRQYEARACK